MRKDLTEGGVTRTILITAWPMVLALLLHTAFNVVDAIYVGRISAEAIGAVSLAWPIMFFIFAIGGGIGVGATSLISRYIGAKKVDKANNIAEHALLIGVVMGLIFTFLGLIFGKDLLLLMGADSLVSLSLSYLNVIFLGTLFMMIFTIGNNILRGEGDTKASMVFIMIATIANIILDPIFIFVMGMGVRGAAIATVIANFIGCVAVVYWFLMGKSSIKINPRQFKFDFSIIKKIFKIGVPSSLSQISMSVSLFVMMRIVSYFGPLAIASFGIVFRLDSIAVLPALGLMFAVIPIVGQNVGAGKFERAEKVAYKTATIAAIFTGVVGLIFFFFPTMVISIFNTDPTVIRYGSLYLRIVPLVYAFIGIGITINGAFLGAGDPIPALVTTLLRVIVIVIPVALLLAFVFKMGLVGVWIAFAISIFISGNVSLIWFKRGNWKKKHVKANVSMVG